MLPWLRIPNCIWDRLVVGVIGELTAADIEKIVTEGFVTWHVDPLDDAADRL